jgi:hypothetical protein
MEEDNMNRFDRAVNKKTNELLNKNLLGQDVDVETINKFRTIARAMIREEMRGVKPNDNPKSLYCKTWKVAAKYDNYIK